MTKAAPIILASTSQIRRELLLRAGVEFTAEPARVDEVAIRASLEAEGAKPRDVADALAEFKARKIAERRPEAVVIGADQVLTFKGRIVAKAETVEEARETLLRLRGEQHRLMSAVVVYEAGKPVWRHMGEARLTMREFTEDWLAGYLRRNAEAAVTSVGAYRLEEEGARLFSRVEGDYFTILGLPLVELLAYLALRGMIEG